MTLDSPQVDGSTSAGVFDSSIELAGDHPLLHFT